jgi:signal peptidase complex subunit 3
MSHTITYRLNALLTHAVTVLAVMCALAAITGASPVPDDLAVPPHAIPRSTRSLGAPLTAPHPRHPAPPSPDEFHVSNPTVDAKVVTLERFTRIDANDEAYLAFSLDADLRSCFSWNTKQIFLSIVAEYESPYASRSEVSVWDRIVERKETALLQIPVVRNKYKMTDRGANLRGREVTFSLRWTRMPHVGRITGDAFEFQNFTFPEEYLSEPETTKYGRHRARRAPETRRERPEGAGGDEKNAEAPRSSTAAGGSATREPPNVVGEL